ncbi:transcription factor [Pseudozyma hubeiensis SY62]|uniref:Transcription factor n=1 Tax=Pseudozyma hubeiensis (strain SY62) TaxID=1305764 RepID=R9P7P9_PSEHS|nr:transcription factor [Pseudozyma hubeiensis SY62]GAC94140.1 transcription factor [Pseudozyma hubeiensis SY62]
MSTHDHTSPYANGNGNGNQLDFQQSSSSGPLRTNDTKADDRDKKGPIAAPVKSACTFCRSRKSRCDGNKPCSACVGRGRPDECLYTVSRRGGKPKPKIDPTQDLQSHLNKLFAMTDMPYAFRRPGGLAGPSSADRTVPPALQPQTLPPSQHQQNVQPHSSVFNIPDQYPSFDPSVLQQSSSTSNHLHMQHQQALPPAQQSAAAFSLNDPMHDPFASMPGFQAGGFLPYQLPDAAHQPHQLLMQPQLTQPNEQDQQHQHQQQQQQQFRPLPQGSQQQQAQLNSFSNTTLQHTPLQQAAPVSSAAHLSNATSPPGQVHADAARTSSAVSPVSNQSPGVWGRVEDAMAAYHASSVAATSSSSQSSSSRHASIDNVSDAAKVNQFSFKTLNAAAAEAGSVKTLLTDYYRYLYRFIPILPPPKHVDVLITFFKPDSAFIYALQCVLPLLRDEIQPIGAMHKLSGQGINFGSEEKKAALRERTLNFERKASDGLDRLLEQADNDETGEKMLEAIQTLCVLVVYEYGSGRAIKARLKADQALGLAMGQGLHKLSHKTSPNETKSARSSFAYVSNAGHPLTSMGVDANDVFEMRKRCWWSVWSLVLWAAYNTGRIPTIRADDPRVKSEMPTASAPDVWTSNISSLQALLLVQDRVLALAQHGQSSDGTLRYEPPQSNEVLASPASSASSPFGFGRLGASRSGSVSSDDVPANFSTLPTRATRQEILDSMLEIDTFLQDQIRIHESTEAPDSPLPSEVPTTGNLAHVEKELEDSLRMAAAVQLYTSSLTLHIGQAFQGASLFERKLCFLNSIKDTKDGANSAVCREPMPVLAHDGSLDLSAYANGGDGGNAVVGVTSTDGGAQPISLTQQDLYARGPFLPRLSLQRCVHASRQLLDIAKRRHGQSVNPNPFNCCSFVLISFVLLMQALAVHGGFAGESGADDLNDQAVDQQQQQSMSMDTHGHGEYANDSLQRVLEHTGDDDAMNGDFEPSVDPVKQAQLRDIWGRVREARDTLMDLGKHWEAVVPMADEVNLCLETSQLLLSNAY